jgi:hypothetical protein
MKMLQRGLAHSTNTGPSVQAKDASESEELPKLREEASRVPRPTTNFSWPSQSWRDSTCFQDHPTKEKEQGANCGGGAETPERC